MIPKNSSAVMEIAGTQATVKPSKTFYLDIENNRIVGMVDNLDAVKQAVLLILGTNRFEHPIYSWNYGIESRKLIGKPMSFVIPELERYVKEALLQDDRITEVKDFSFTRIDRGKLGATFTVVSVFGSFPSEKEVSV